MTSALLAPIILAPLLILGLDVVPARAAHPLPAGREPSPAAWERLAAARIYFAHNSVGENMLGGLARALAERPEATLRLARWSAGPPRPGLSHGPIGENERPLAKLRDFERVMAEGVGQGADWAVFKFCYADLTAGGDPEALFASYRQAMNELGGKWPVGLVHMTMPLTSPQTGPKAWAKTLLGKSPRGYADNAVRQRFNDLLRAAYAGQAPLFDLAALESSRPDGSRVLVAHDGRLVEALNPDFTDDGGHLNEVGARFVAEAFLRFLAGLDREGAGLDESRPPDTLPNTTSLAP